MLAADSARLALTSLPAFPASSIVYGTDSITNPDLPFRIFNNIPLNQPGGGNVQTWYNPPEGKSKAEGYITDGFCKEFLAAQEKK